MNRLFSGLICAFSCIATLPTSAQDVSQSAASSQASRALLDTASRHMTQEQIRAAAKAGRLQVDQNALSRYFRSHTRASHQTPPAPNAVDNRVQNQVGERPSTSRSAPHAASSLAMEILAAQEALRSQDRLPSAHVPDRFEPTSGTPGDLPQHGVKTREIGVESFTKTGKTGAFSAAARARAAHRALFPDDVSARATTGVKAGGRFTALAPPEAPADLAAPSVRKQSKPDFSNTRRISPVFKGKLASRLEHLRVGVSSPHSPSQVAASYSGLREGRAEGETKNRTDSLSSITYSGLGEGIYGSRIRQSASYSEPGKKQSSLEDPNIDGSLLSDTSLFHGGRAGRMPGTEYRGRPTTHTISGRRHSASAHTGASDLRPRRPHNITSEDSGSSTRL